MQSMQTYQSKPNAANLQKHQTKPKLLVKAVDALVPSAFGNVCDTILPALSTISHEVSWWNILWY